ncbi:MAG: hypothetical protein H6559_25970 [Lewinellaceae bacterium]|nr:hypothetical protein [Lewinellaceae bacterium]
MKTGFVILMSVLMAFLLGCQKDEFLPTREGSALTADFRDVPAEPQLPAWKVAILEIDDYITEMVDENVLAPRLGEVLMAQSGIVEDLLEKGIKDEAREHLQVFDGKVETMVEKGYFPDAYARPLFGMTKNLSWIIDGKLVQFADGFESCETGVFPHSRGWVLQRNGRGEGFQAVSDEMAVYGTKSLKLEGNIGWPAVTFKPMKEMARVVFAEARVYIRDPKPGVVDGPKAAFGFGYLEEGYLGKHVHRAFVYFDTNGYVYFGATGVKSEKLMAWQGEEWYNIRIGYDDAFERGSLWINGELVLEDFSLKGPQGAYAGVLLDSGWDAHTITYFDDVMVWAPAE